MFSLHFLRDHHTDLSYSSLAEAILENEVVDSDHVTLIDSIHVISNVVPILNAQVFS